MIAVGREGWILIGFVALAVAGLTIAVAGGILLFRQRRGSGGRPLPSPTGRGGGSRGAQAPATPRD